MTNPNYYPPSPSPTESVDERNPIELLATDFLERRRRGEDLDINEYVARYPELAENLHDLISAMQALEGLKSKREAKSGGKASIGPNKIDRLGDFRIVREIGRGGMGVVYEAEQESLNRRVAIKLLPRQSLLSERQLKRFEREAKTAANLHHPNIVPVFGVGLHDGHHYYVMQLIDGVGLDHEEQALSQDRIATLPNARVATDDRPLLSPVVDLFRSDAGDTSLRKGPPPVKPRDAARMIEQAARGLQYAHEQGVLHRDIKPANLIRDAKGHVWISDFGLAKAASDSALSVTGELAGTLAFMPPERFHGEEDARSDVYSLGLTLYELATGKPAFPANNDSQLMERILRGQPVPPHKHKPGFSHDLETIILKAIAREPKNRYQTAKEFADDLQRWMNNRPIRARRTPAWQRLWLWSRRHPTIAVLSTIVAVQVLVLFYVLSTEFWNAKAEATRSAVELLEEEHRRQQAEQTANEAVDTLNKIFESLNGMVAASKSAGPLEEEAEPAPLSAEDESVLETMATYHNRIADGESTTPQAILAAAESSRKLGNIRRRMGDYEAAEDAYRKSLEKYDQLRSMGVEPDRQTIQMAAVNHDLGVVLRAIDEHGWAFSSFLEGLALLDELGDDLPPELDAQKKVEQAKILFFSEKGPGAERGPFAPPPPGVGSRHYHPNPKAVKDVARAVKLLTELQAEYPQNLEYQRLLAVGYRKQAQRRTSSEATRLRKEALDILRKVTQAEPDNTAYQYELATAILNEPHGESIEPSTNSARAEELDEALAIAGKLMNEHPGAPAFSVQYANVLYRHAILKIEMHKVEAAKDDLARAESLMEDWQHALPDSPAVIVWLAGAKHEIAVLALKNKKFSLAEEKINEAINAVLSLPQASQGTHHMRRTLDALYDTAAAIDRAANPSQQNQDEPPAREERPRPPPDRHRPRPPFPPPPPRR